MSGVRASHHIKVKYTLNSDPESKCVESHANVECKSLKSKNHM